MKQDVLPFQYAEEKSSTGMMGLPAAQLALLARSCAFIERTVESLLHKPRT